MGCFAVQFATRLHSLTRCITVIQLNWARDRLCVRVSVWRAGKYVCSRASIYVCGVCVCVCVCVCVFVCAITVLLYVWIVHFAFQTNFVLFCCCCCEIVILTIVVNVVPLYIYTFYSYQTNLPMGINRKKPV